MEHKKEIPKLSRKRRESTDLFAEEPAGSSNTNASIRPISTPIRINNPSEDEDSPYFPCSTQEMVEGVDVLWDWNSPQSKPKTSFTRKSRKKLNLQHSPKVPLRRHPSNNNEQIKQDFNKIREELRALKAEIAKPDHEESLVLSPREEEAFKREENDNHMHDFDHNIIEEHPPPDEDNFQDPFDDDMDEELILFSQRIEKTMQNTENKVKIENLNIIGAKISSSSAAMESKTSKRINSNIDQIQNKYSSSLPKITNYCNNLPVVGKCGDKKLLSVMSENSKINAKNKQVITLQDSETSVFNDSFDNVLSQMDDDDLDQLTQVVDIKQYKNGNKDLKIDKKCKVFPRSQSEDIIVTGAVQMTSRKVEWHRTQSFENYNAQLSKEKLQEIERKRLEAKAKRDAKKKQDIIGPIITEVPETITCSPDEIEKKRLHALEKLEAKRLQDIIDKKKQEALKRREKNRKKNAANVKSSLTTRL